jgi:hypothetical protein
VGHRDEDKVIRILLDVFSPQEGTGGPGDPLRFAVVPRLEALGVCKGERACTNEDLIHNAAYSWSP